MTSASTAKLLAGSRIWTTSQEAQCIVAVAYCPVLCGRDVGGAVQGVHWVRRQGRWTCKILAQSKRHLCYLSEGLECRNSLQCCTVRQVDWHGAVQCGMGLLGQAAEEGLQSFGPGSVTTVLSDSELSADTPTNAALCDKHIELRRVTWVCLGR